ncbi:MAG: transcription termination/antitermination NusG family protein [Verrucomicrobiota bacterium]
MTENTNIEKPRSGLYWYCLRTQTKREHIAASILAQIEKVEVLCPRISQIKKTRAGKKRFVEALFPGYIFAKFDFAEQNRQVMHSQGVTRIVEHGERRIVPDSVIAELKSSLPKGVIEAPDPSIEPGAAVECISGSLKGLNGKVMAQLPSGQRIQLLLEILGREISVEVDPADIILAQE